MKFYFVVTGSTKSFVLVGVQFKLTNSSGERFGNCGQLLLYPEAYDALKKLLAGKNGVSYEIDERMK